MNTQHLHKNSLLLTAFISDEPMKRWVYEDETYISDFHKSWDSLMPVVRQISIASLIEKKISSAAYEQFIIHVQTAFLSDDVADAYTLCVRLVQHIRDKESGRKSAVVSA